MMCGSVRPIAGIGKVRNKHIRNFICSYFASFLLSILLLTVYLFFIRKMSYIAGYLDWGVVLFLSLAPILFVDIRSSTLKSITSVGVLFSILLLSVLQISVWDGISVKLQQTDVSIVAKVSDRWGMSSGDKRMVKGELEIINNSSDTIKYSNKDLYLVVLNKSESRTYVKSIGSHIIDFAHVDIDSGDSLKQSVYWFLPPIKALREQSLRLKWRNNLSD